MAAAKNEVFIGLLHEDFYIGGRDLTFGLNLNLNLSIYLLGKQS